MRPGVTKCELRAMKLVMGDSFQEIPNKLVMVIKLAVCVTRCDHPAVCVTRCDHPSNMGYVILMTLCIM